MKYTLWLFNSSPWFVDGPNRNIWFTVLNSMVDLSMAIAVSHNQMVFIIYSPLLTIINHE